MTSTQPTTTSLGDTTLGDLVIQDSRRARILESLDLDYCCGGGRTLADACEQAGLDVNAIAPTLDLPEDPPAQDWLPLGPAALAQHIVDVHHAYLWSEMPRLTALVAKVHGVHGERHPELAKVRDLYAAAVADLEGHLTKEEKVLFPAIEQFDAQGRAATFPFGRLANPINAMLGEHDHVGALFAQIREVTDGYAMPADGCPSYRSMLEGLEQMELDLHEHVHKENNVLFPRVLEIETGLLGEQ